MRNNSFLLPREKVPARRMRGLFRSVQSPVFVVSNDFLPGPMLAASATLSTLPA
jgi:hypothetical protein